MHARILADLTTAGFSAGNLILAARCAGELESLGTPAPHKTADPAYATFVEEGRAGGIELLTRLYPWPVGTGTGIPG